MFLMSSILNWRWKNSGEEIMNILRCHTEHLRSSPLFFHVACVWYWLSSTFRIYLSTLINIIYIYVSIIIYMYVYTFQDKYTPWFVSFICRYWLKLCSVRSNYRITIRLNATCFEDRQCTWNKQSRTNVTCIFNVSVVWG